MWAWSVWRTSIGQVLDGCAGPQPYRVRIERRPQQRAAAGAAAQQRASRAAAAALHAAARHATRCGALRRPRGPLFPAWLWRARQTPAERMLGRAAALPSDVSRCFLQFISSCWADRAIFCCEHRAPFRLYFSRAFRKVQTASLQRGEGQGVMVCWRAGCLSMVLLWCMRRQSASAAQAGPMAAGPGPRRGTRQTACDGACGG